MNIDNDGFFRRVAKCEECKRATQGPYRTSTVQPKKEKSEMTPMQQLARVFKWHTVVWGIVAFASLAVWVYAGDTGGHEHLLLAALAVTKLSNVLGVVALVAWGFTRIVVANQEQDKKTKSGNQEPF